MAGPPLPQRVRGAEPLPPLTQYTTREFTEGWRGVALEPLWGGGPQPYYPAGGNRATVPARRNGQPLARTPTLISRSSVSVIQGVAKNAVFYPGHWV